MISWRLTEKRKIPTRSMCKA